MVFNFTALGFLFFLESETKLVCVHLVQVMLVNMFVDLLANYFSLLGRRRKLLGKSRTSRRRRR